MPSCLIGLGSNLGDRAGTLDRAIAELGRCAQIDTVAASRWYETAPVGGPEAQSPYLNGAALVHTTLPPRQMLGELGRIEQILGRQRSERWQARTLDLDLLLYDDVVLNEPELQIPHPRMAFRRFVLLGAAEVAPKMVHPSVGWTIERLLEHLDNAVPYIAIAGPPGCGKTDLAETLVGRFSGRMVAQPARIPQAAMLIQIATSGADSAGRAWDREIELLLRRAELLDQDRWPADAELSLSVSLSVSDFWFDQSIVFARERLSDDLFARFSRRWHDARRRVTRPKLLVVLDAPAEWITARSPSGTQRGGTDRIERHRALLTRQTRQTGLGPVLRLDATDQATTRAETIAAVEAMN